MTGTNEDWHEKSRLHCILPNIYPYFNWGDSLSPSYVIEAILPTEIEKPSLRVLMEIKLEERNGPAPGINQLNFIEEKRLTALCHGQC